MVFLSRSSGRQNYSFHVTHVSDSCSESIRNIKKDTDSINDSVNSIDIGRKIEINDSLIAFKLGYTVVFTTSFGSIDDLHNSMIDSNTKRLHKNIVFIFVSKDIKSNSKFVKVEQEW